MGLKTSVLSEHDTVTPFIRHQLYVSEVLTPQNLQKAWQIGQEHARQEFRTSLAERNSLSASHSAPFWVHLRQGV